MPTASPSAERHQHNYRGAFTCYDCGAPGGPAPTLAALDRLDAGGGEVIPDWDRCGCACKCRYRANDAEGFGMCGNCLRWWIKASDRCICELDGDDPCKCGAISKHWQPV